MKITILGTGHGTDIECYNTCFVPDDLEIIYIS